MCKSEPHTPTAATSSSTSSGPTSGTGTWRSSTAPFCAAKFTTAGWVVGIVRAENGFRRTGSKIVRGVLQRERPVAVVTRKGSGIGAPQFVPHDSQKLPARFRRRLLPSRIRPVQYREKVSELLDAAVHERGVSAA